LRLRDKLHKAADPRAAASARRHFGRTFRLRRWFPPLTAAVLKREIERSGFAEIASRYRVKDPGTTPRKYLDLDHWLEVNLRRVLRLELDFGPRRRVLDLGMGAGYFLFICQWLGHEVLGLDIDEDPMFAELSVALQVPRRVARIEAFVPLPECGAKFDVITAYMICFNNNNRPDVWGAPEWSFFLDDLAHHLREDGRVWLEFNRGKGAGHFTPELRSLFEHRGAVIDHHRVIFNSRPRARG
jgi:SAM-dependent methyltransferase